MKNQNLLQSLLTILLVLLCQPVLFAQDGSADSWFDSNQGVSTPDGRIRVGQQLALSTPHTNGGWGGMFANSYWDLNEGRAERIINAPVSEVTLTHEGDMLFRTAVTGQANTEIVWGPPSIKVHNAGGVSINTWDMPVGYELAVDGKVVFEEAKIKLSQNWPDYVFKPNYQKPSLEELEEHIIEEGHLPNVPSAKTVEKEGYFLGEMDVLLLEKIEELTLYLIELNKDVKVLSAENKSLKADNLELKTLIKTVGLDK